jgi:hypothetical protein
MGGPVPKVDSLSSIELKFNGHDRISPREAPYFRLLQPYQAHSSIPNQFIYAYSFALFPEQDVSPSGSANVSRIDNVVYQLEFTTDSDGSSALTQDGLLYVYARNHNVMKIAGGMGALRYSN